MMIVLETCDVFRFDVAIICSFDVLPLNFLNLCARWWTFPFTFPCTGTWKTLLYILLIPSWWSFQLAMKKKGMEDNQLFELDGVETLGSYLQIQPCSDNAPDLSECSIQWYRISSEGGKKELISGILFSSSLQLSWHLRRKTKRVLCWLNSKCNSMPGHTIICIFLLVLL